MSSSYTTSAVGSHHGGGSWLATKKRGRDDDRIAKDQAAALRRRREERLRQRQNNNKPPAAASSSKKRHDSKKTTNNKKKKNSNEARRSRTSRGAWESDDDEEEVEESLSEDSFIVNDDDEEEDESEDDAHLGLEKDEASSLSSSDDAPQRRQRQRGAGTGTKQASRKPPKSEIHAKPPRIQNLVRPGHQRVAAAGSDSSRRTHNGTVGETIIDLLSDDVDEEASDLAPFPPHRRSGEQHRLGGILPNKKLPAARAALKRASSHEDSDDDVLLMTTPSRKQQSKYFHQQKQAQSLQNPSLLDSCSPLPARRPPQGRSNVVAARRRVLNESSDDDNNDSVDINKNDNTTVDVDDTGSVQDPDEAHALRLALRESLRDSQRQQGQQQPPSHHCKLPPLATVSSSSTSTLSGRGGGALAAVDRTFLDTEDDSEPDAPEELLQDDDDGNDDDDAYEYNEDARAAVSVLEAANRLSAQVLAIMTEWACGSGGKKEPSDASCGVDGIPERSIPMGMIVDGALALSGLTQQAADTDGDAARQNDPRRRWISRELLERLCPSVILGDYQLVGVNWLALMHGLTCEVPDSSGRGNVRRSNVNGVLADEMGLGKTVQTIVFLRYLKHIQQQENPGHCPLPHLVVAPSSVLSNWEREFKKFAPDLHVVKYHGSLAERAELQDQLSDLLPSSRSAVGTRRKAANATTGLDVLLTPVTYFQTERGEDRNFLRRFRFDYMIVDEAHMLKNAQGKRYRSLDKFQTQHRLLLTGTPVQNSPKELLSLLCFLMPLFGKKSTTSDEYDETSKGNDGGASMLQHFVSLEGQKGSSDEAAYRKLKQLFAPFVLRRKKSEVLQQIIPPKHQCVEFVELTSGARAIYDSILADHFRRKELGQPAMAGEHLFTQLRKAAHHPLLLRTRHVSQAEKDHLACCFHQYGAFRGEGCTRKRVNEQLQGFSDFDIHLMALELLAENPTGRENDLRRYVLDEDDLFCSSKFECLRKLVPQLVQAGHRILIFSIWTNCLDLLSCLMESLDLRHLRMDGDTPVTERQALIDEFNDDDSIPVFLLSTKACGLGINLTAADTCIIHDLDFNPFNDLQAEDRCHRIGQTKPVTVYKLVSKSTVDDDIFCMQERKAKMNAAIMDAPGSTSTNWETEKRLVLQTAVDRYLRNPHPSQDDGHDDITPVDAGNECDDVAL